MDQDASNQGHFALPSMLPNELGAEAVIAPGPDVVPHVASATTRDITGGEKAAAAVNQGIAPDPVPERNLVRIKVPLSQPPQTDSIPVYDAQEDDEKTDSDVDMPLPVPPPVAIAANPAAGAGPKRRGGGGRGVISLRMLIDEGYLQPGEDVLSVEYKQNTHVATLLPDGRITTNINGKDMTFDSPSAFSIFLKRLVNPTRKADDGWKTVKYQGRLLEHYKTELARKRVEDAGGDLSSFAPLEPRSKKARTDTVRGNGFAPKFSFGIGAPMDPSSGVDRARRQRRAPPRFAAIGVDDEHALQPLEACAPGAQPFTVRVSPAVEAMMDFHAHLCMNEVIGMLAGHWDPVSKRIDIVRAIPVREVSTEDDAINVEMDPPDQVARTEEARTAGLRVVGWYHSHPTFPAAPSTIDVYNQVLQQHMHRQEGDAPAEPYVAAIVGPYDTRNVTCTAALTWFYVDHAPGVVPAEGQRPDELGCIGKQLVVESLREPLGTLDDLPGLQKEMEQLAKRYAQMPERANLEAPWKDGSLRVEKLVNSLVSRLPVELLGDQKIARFGEKVLFSTRAVWNVYGKPLVLAGAGQVGAGLVAAAAAAAAGGSGTVSTAVSEGGHDGGSAYDIPGDVDEPISDEDDDGL